MWTVTLFFPIYKTAYRIKTHHDEECLPDATTLFEAIGGMRKDETSWYRWIMTTFAPAVVTRHKLIEGIKANLKWSEIVTTSDEAFIITMVLNYWNAWVPVSKKITMVHWG